MDDLEGQIEFLKEKLAIVREQMPETPLEAEKKAMEVGLLEEQLAELYAARGHSSTIPAKRESDSLTEEIAAITDELMAIEIRMLKAEMEGNDDEKVKLQLSTNALKSRRQTLIDEVRASSVSPKKKEDELESRVASLEKEVADLKTLLYQFMTR